MRSLIHSTSKIPEIKQQAKLILFLLSWKTATEQVIGSMLHVMKGYVTEEAKSVGDNLSEKVII